MRKKSVIDFTVVDEMLEAGCTGEEVAARLGIHADTLYNRIQEDFKTGFSAYRQQKIAKGDQVLRKTLFDKAKNGDTASLIFLNKTRLGMSENVQIEIPAIDKFSKNLIKIEYRHPEKESTN